MLLTVCLSVCLSACLPVCLSVSLSLSRFLSLHLAVSCGNLGSHSMSATRHVQHPICRLCIVRAAAANARGRLPCAPQRRDWRECSSWRTDTGTVAAPLAALLLMCRGCAVGFIGLRRVGHRPSLVCCRLRCGCVPNFFFVACRWLSSLLRVSGQIGWLRAQQRKRTRS